MLKVHQMLERQRASSKAQFCASKYRFYKIQNCYTFKGLSQKVMALDLKSTEISKINKVSNPISSWPKSLHNTGMHFYQFKKF